MLSLEDCIYVIDNQNGNEYRWMCKHMSCKGFVVIKNDNFHAIRQIEHHWMFYMGLNDALLTNKIILKRYSIANEVLFPIVHLKLKC